MATALTHLGFVNDLKKLHNNQFDFLNINYVYSGALFPDYYGFYKIQLKKNYEIESIIKNKNGIDFGKKMFSLAKTKEEKSFAIGFITHSVLDKNFHNYLKKKKTSIEEHLMLEFFYDCKFKKIKIPIVLYPKKIIEETLEKHYKQTNIKKTDITLFKLWIYYLFLKEIQTQIINKKYLANKKSYINGVAKIFYRGKFNLNKLLTPNLDLKEKHLKNLEKEYKKSLIETNKIIEQLKVS